MNTLASIVLAILVAALGCYLSAHFIPSGTPQLLAEIFSVLVGFGVVGFPYFSGQRRL